MRQESEGSSAKTSAVREGGATRLYVFEVDDSDGDCPHYFSASTEEIAVKVAREDFGIGDDYGPVTVRRLPDDEVLNVGWSDDPPEENVLPPTATIEMEEGRIFGASATAKEWAENCGDGVYIAGGEP